MTVTRSFDFNSGTDAATITATGMIAGVTGTPQYQTAALKHGARGMGFAAAATTSDFIRWARSGADTHSVSFYWQPKSIAGSATAFLRIADSANGVIAALRYRQSDNKWDIGNGDQSVNFLSNHTWALDTWYRINVKCDFTSVTNPVFTVDIFAPDETDASQTPYDTFGGVIPTVLTYDRDLLGRVGTSASTRHFWLDTLKVSDNFLEIIQAEVPLPVYDNFDTAISTGSDDGSWNSVGTFSTTADALLLGDPNPSDYDRSVYFRFQNVLITQGSVIHEAHLTPRVWFTNGSSPDPVKIYGIKVANPTVPSNNTDIVTRTRTTAHVDWSPSFVDGSVINTPDLTAIIQELVNQVDWVSGNAMMFTLEDGEPGYGNSGSISFYSYENDSSSACQLHTQFEEAAVGTDPVLVAMMVGNLAPTGFTVSCKSRNATTAAIEVSVNSDMTSSTTGSSVTPDAGNGWCKPVITGLSAGVQYYYRIKLNGVRQTSLEGEAKTLPVADSAANFTFLCTSCANTNSNHEVFDAMRAYTGAHGKPLFMVHNGDFHYVYSGGASAPNDTDTRRAEYEAVLSNAPRQAELFRKIPQYYGWSDVDSCGSNCDGTYPGFPAVAAAYRQVFPSPTLPDSGNGAVYFSWAVGRVLFIRTDHRFYSSAKAAPDNASKTNLGAEQESWLYSKLSDPGYPVKVWIHENKWVGTPVTDGNTDNWQTYSTVRQRVADFITSNRIKVLYIHGDSHSFAADNGTNNPVGNFPYVVSAPMIKDAQVWTPPTTNGRYPDVALASTAGYGAFDVTDTGTNIEVAFTGYTDDGTPRVTMSTSWSTVEGVSIRVADGLGGTDTATFQGVLHADGTTILPATLLGVWDGSAIQPLV
jgi:hypothetical protein